MAAWSPGLLFAQNQIELNKGWKCASLKEVKAPGTEISLPAYSVHSWMNAVVPGTVLTTLLENKKVPDPFYGMNNEKIPDIYKTGRDYYTYWFVNDFTTSNPKPKEQVWLHFRGVNAGCDVYLNGHRLNAQTQYSMFLRQTYNITSLLKKDGHNRLAVIVYPPDPVGNPNGGQGGDGTIARNISHQYTAGWDWIQPIRDRNTGIWDKVTIERTLQINLKDPHVITLVSGVRKPEGAQEPAILKVSTELENPTSSLVQGTASYEIDGQTVTKEVSVEPHSTMLVQFGDFSLKNPRLWWPAGYGPQNLYPVNFKFLVDGSSLSDSETVSVGVREIRTYPNTETKSREISVNGQKIFIKGGDWIISDEMLRLSEKRYDTEIRFHRDMNLNLIRIWGGALVVERPEFYAACDKYGLLVFQDFGFSGDCNGRWLDPMKKEDQWIRRTYPNDHQLYIQTAADQVKLVRNHPSLAFWCGGNEITPPRDIFHALKDSIMPLLDGTRWFIDYSNSDEMSMNTLGGNGDGPYEVQPTKRFWEYRTFPFNSEVGSVGVGDYESLKRFIPREHLVAPLYTSETKTSQVDPVWEYHKYIGYDASIDPYGKAKDAEDFATKAQLVNYDQYRALMEGFSSHMWSWYTGVIIWKTQNPWTALRGQMYDYYLDPNACLYGLRNGSQPLHVMCNPIDGMVMVVNNTFECKRDLMLVAKAYSISGKDSLISQSFVEIGPSTTKKYFPVKPVIDNLAKKQGAFLCLQLLDADKKLLSENIYWLPDENGDYSGLKQMPQSRLTISAREAENDKVIVTLANPAKNPVSFFNRLSLLNAQTKQRILPSFYSDNYVSVLPGETKEITIETSAIAKGKRPLVSVKGWNEPEQVVAVGK